MKKFIKVITGFGLAVVMGSGVFASALDMGTVTAYATEVEARIRVGLPNSVLRTRSEFLVRYDGYAITYDNTVYTAAEFFDAYNGLDFSVTVIPTDDSKAITVALRSGETETPPIVPTSSQSEEAAMVTAASSPSVNEQTALGREGYASDVEYMLSEEYMEAVRQEFYRLINEYRKANGLRELEIDLELQAYADIRANERRTIRGHIRPDGSHARSGWIDVENGTQGSYGENAASNRILKISPAEQAASYFNGWKNSEGHNRHMLLDFESNIKMGFGMAVGLNDVGVATSPAIFASGY